MVSFPSAPQFIRIQSSVSGEREKEGKEPILSCVESQFILHRSKKGPLEEIDGGAGDLAVEAEKKERIISQVLPAVTHDFLFHLPTTIRLTVCRLDLSEDRLLPYGWKRNYYSLQSTAAARSGW